MVKFKFLAQFPVDHLAHPVVSYLKIFFVLIWCIRLLSDWSFRLYHHKTYICCFVASYLFLLWYDCFLWRCFVLQLEEIQYLYKVLLSQRRLGFLVWDVAYQSLKTSIALFFFLCLFSDYCRSDGFRVVAIVSGGCNKSFSVPFYVDFKSLDWCINAVFNSGKSSSFFFSGNISSVNVISKM